MTEGHIGRLVAASLHQAIAEELPDRLEFYENWLHSEGLRWGTIGRAPMLAVLGFLRTEGGDYHRVVERAGTLSAEWAVTSVAPYRRRVAAWVPRRFRLRPALRMARLIADVVAPHSHVKVRTRAGVVRFEVPASMFCAVRGVHPGPLCGFYRALFVTTLAHFGVRVTAEVEQCRAMGAEACVMTVHVHAAQPVEQPVAA